MFLSNFLFNCHLHLISLECHVFTTSPTFYGLGREEDNKKAPGLYSFYKTIIGYADMCQCGQVEQCSRTMAL